MPGIGSDSGECSMGLRTGDAEKDRVCVESPNRERLDFLRENEKGEELGDEWSAVLGVGAG